MNRTFLGVIIIVIILAVGGLLVFSKGNGSKNTTTTNTTTTINVNSSPSAGLQKSIKDLLGAKTSQQCTFKTSTDGDGTVYITDGKMRSDFVIVAQGAINSHMIIDGQASYMWMDGQTTGVKMSLDIANTPKDAAITQSQSFDVSQETNYDCKPWTVDSSLFRLPTGITFSDMSAIKTDSNINCSTCDNVPAASQAQCKAAIGC